MHRLSRRTVLGTLAGVGVSALTGSLPQIASAGKKDQRWEDGISKGLSWLKRTQSNAGSWNSSNTATGNAGLYPVAMTALCGTAMIASGSTTTQGPYAKSIRRAVDYLLSKLRSNGLIGEPGMGGIPRDDRYTYGHGFSMLFLSQVLGEEEDEDRRKELVDALTKAVQFSGEAQTKPGGWGYVSAKDQSDFDEGSTTITQVQGLRGCRNSGIVVAGDVIDKAKDYIYSCKNPDGGISYSSRNRGSSRPAITAAALATLYNAGDYDSKHVPEMLEYCKKNLVNLTEGANSFGHWHYTYLYYSQVMYRLGEVEWAPFRDKLYNKIVGEQRPDGNWDGNIGPVYVTACNLIMLQLDKAYLPIYQR